MPLAVSKAICVFSAVFALALSAMAAMRIQLSSDVPDGNMLEGENVDFEDGLAGWTNRHSNEVYCVESPGHGLAIRCPGDRKSVNRYIGMKRFCKGKSYVLSCDVKPSREISTARGRDGKSGLGCSISFWDKKRERCELVACRAEGPDRWFRISSRPITVPMWADRANLTVGVQYSKGHGLVDNIALVDAGGELNVSVTSDGAAIRQVKIADENRNIVYDSGLMSGGVSWSRRVPVEPMHRFTVYAVDADGDVAMSELDTSAGL